MQRIEGQRRPSSTVLTFKGGHKAQRRSQPDLQQRRPYRRLPQQSDDDIQDDLCALTLDVDAWMRLLTGALSQKIIPKSLMPPSAKPRPTMARPF
ncbi:MAG: hypothetical protein HXY40_00255 [Chloroflexi bacterium]|nr:hypothetical protein [Chloroflexota bacterium]